MSSRGGRQPDSPHSEYILIMVSMPTAHQCLSSRPARPNGLGSALSVLKLSVLKAAVSRRIDGPVVYPITDVRRRPRGSGRSAPVWLTRYRAATFISGAGAMEVVMLVLMIVLLVLWLILAIVGFAIKGLLWLAIIGIVLFVGTAAIGAVRRRALRR